MAISFEFGDDLCDELYAMSDLHISFQIYGIHWRTVRQGWSYQEHDHPLLELNLVLKGSQITRVDDKEYIQGPGDLLLIPPGKKHASRAEGAGDMTFFCLHLNIGDHFMVEPFYHLTDNLHDKDSDLTRAIKPLLDHLIEEASCSPALSSAHQRVKIQTTAINLVAALSEMFVDDKSGYVNRDFNEADRRTMLEAVVMREQTLLEKRVQDLFYEPIGAAAPNIYESLLPPYRWISVCCLTKQDTPYWGKKDRAFARWLLKEVLSPLGEVVIVDEELQMTAVMFSNQISVPPVEQKLLEAEKSLQENLDPNLQIGFGGIATDLRDIGSMYEQSLRVFSTASLDAASGYRTIEFVNRTVRMAMNRLETDYVNKDFSLGLLAESLGITPNYLSALFTTETGMSFTQHLTRIRMVHAKRLLSNSQIKIYQICEEVGYSDPAYFSRLFKSLEEMSPFAYRKYSKVKKN